MYILEKLKQHGPIWFLRRIVREIINPSTDLGRNFKHGSLFMYFLCSKPINTINYFARYKIKSHDCLYFFYDFEVEPVTYDFAWALCIANAKRSELGLTHLHVVFVAGSVQGLRKETQEYEQIVTKDARDWRVGCVLLPIIKLLPFPVSVSFCVTRHEAMLIRENHAKFVYPEKYNVTFPISYSPAHGMIYGQKILSLRADKQALIYVSEWLENQKIKKKKLIVITIRQYAYQPKRNSNMLAWLKFASELDKDEFFIVFIPDTEHAFNLDENEFKKFYLFHPACWNLKLRAALYELAFLNLGVNTGPMALCWLNAQCRYITFKTIVKNGPQGAIDELVNRGYVVGENPLFANAFQKWVWEEDDYNVICREFWLMCDYIVALLK